MAFLRVWGILFLALLALYAVLSVWLRLRERRRLAEAWDAGEGKMVERAAWIETGMAAYDLTLRSRLLWLVIVLPMAGFAILLYLLNRG